MRPAATTRRAFLALAGVAAVGTAVSCASPGPSASSGAGQGGAGDRQVWAHMVPQGLPLVHDDDIHYGSERPLTYAATGTDYHELVAGQLDQARAAGLTGLQILLIEGENTGSDYLADWMDAADPTWQGEDAQGFALAPCLLVSSRDGAVELLEQYAVAAQGHSSAARADDALVVWVYDARSLTPEDWTSCRDALADGGTQLHLVAELGTAASQHGDALDTASLDPYGDTFDAVWLFEDREPLVLDDFVAWAAGHGTVFAGGTLPGYDRETDGGGYADARATELWRTQLARARDSGAVWLTAVTWNDAVEHTSVQPTTDWGTTRADLLAHHAAAFREEEPADHEATAYVTSPQFLVAGEQLLVEGLAVNHTTNDVAVTVRVTDADGQTLTASEPTTVPAGEVGAAVVERTVEAAGGDHVHAVVELRDGSGALLHSTRGAPVVVFGVRDTATPEPNRRRYYSLSTAGAAEFDELARLEPGEDDAAPDGLRVVVEQPVRSVELLHNTWPAGIALDAREVSYRAPPESIVGGQRVSTVPRGFTLARLVTEDGRIAYSAPVHHGTA